MEDKRLVKSTPETGQLTSLVKRVGDDLSTLAKDHIELARAEFSGNVKAMAADTAAILLGGIVALFGLAMLCVTAAVAAEPLIPKLWIRLFIFALIFMALGVGMIMGFVKKAKGEPLGLKKTKTEVSRTAEVLKEQVTHG